MINIELSFCGRIYADQLHSLLQRITPDMKELMLKKRMERNETVGASSAAARRKLTDEEKVMDLIHGITEQRNHPTGGTVSKPAMKRNHGGLGQRFPEGGLFEGAFQGPRMFGQSIISQTIRRPDGVSIYRCYFVRMSLLLRHFRSHSHTKRVVLFATPRATPKRPLHCPRRMAARKRSPRTMTMRPLVA